MRREVRQHHIDILGGYFADQHDEIERQFFFETLENDNVVSLAAEDNGKIIGYIPGDFKELPYLLSPKTANISNFGLSRNYRHQGIERQLMDASFEICQKLKVQEIPLGVYNKNVSAYKFYKNYRFKSLEQKMVFDLTEK